MRYTIIKGVDTDFNLEIVGNVDIICAVMDISTRGSGLTYEADLTGAEIIKLLSPFKVDLDGILPNKNYTITAYDW